MEASGTSGEKACVICVPATNLALSTFLSCVITILSQFSLILLFHFVNCPTFSKSSK